MLGHNLVICESRTSNYRFKQILNNPTKISSQETQSNHTSQRGRQAPRIACRIPNAKGKTMGQDRTIHYNKIGFNVSQVYAKYATIGDNTGKHTLGIIMQ